MSSILSILQNTPLIPVIVIEDANLAVPLAETLQKSGINSIEITFRTAAAKKAIRNIKDAVPGMSVGAGTIISPDLLKQALDVGSDYIVTPGTTDALLSALQKEQCPALPGVATTSEVIRALDYGFTKPKYFPASLNGGVKGLQNMAGLFSQVSFCPTGGISADTMLDYLALPNVFSIGGSWLAGKDVIAKQDWKAISLLASQAMSKIKNA